MILLLSIMVGMVGLLVYYMIFRVTMNPYDQPFCDDDGTCHEKPNHPSPRTPYSCWSKDQCDRWWDYFHVLNERSDAYARRRTALKERVQVVVVAEEKEEEEASATAAASSSSSSAVLSNNNTDDDDDTVASIDTNTTTKPSTTTTKVPTTTIARPLILLGDSITESWVGTGLGRTSPRTSGIPQILVEELSSTAGLDPLVLAISGDQTQHLLYRLQNGHLHDAFAKDPTAVFVVMIGTNNLGSGELAGPTAQGVLAVAEYLLRHVDGRVLLFGLLPRGDGIHVLPMLCPPRCREDGTPYQSFLPAIDYVNQELKDGVALLVDQYPRRSSSSSSTSTNGGETHNPLSTPSLTYIDCGEAFLVTDSDKEDSSDGDSGDNNNNNDSDTGKDGDNNDSLSSSSSSTTSSMEVKVELMPDLLHPNAAGHKILSSCIRTYLNGLDS